MDMKNKNKGFTLIELLVVVAIIGILAAVGTVAYTGYTAGAKKSSTKSNHAAAVKYIAAEDQKCNIGEDTAMGGALTCLGRTGADIIDAANVALADFKNPFAPDSAGIRGGTTAGKDADGNDIEIQSASYAAEVDKGFVNLEVDASDASGKTILVTTCYDNDCKTAATDHVTNKISVAE